MVRFSLIPREEHFFDDFVGMAEEIRGGARLLKQMLAVDPPDMPQRPMPSRTSSTSATDGRGRSSTG